MGRSYELGTLLAEHCHACRSNIFGAAPLDSQGCLVVALDGHVFGEGVRGEIELGRRLFLIGRRTWRLAKPRTYVSLNVPIAADVRWARK